jgi:hypothetical protein
VFLSHELNNDENNDVRVCVCVCVCVCVWMSTWMCVCMCVYECVRIGPGGPIDCQAGTTPSEHWLRQPQKAYYKEVLN